MKMFHCQPIRKHFDMSKQRIRVLLKTDGKLFVHGQRVQSHQQPLLLYYSGNVSLPETVYFSIIMIKMLLSMTLFEFAFLENNQ
jgi:hypothetical protein